MSVHKRYYAAAAMELASGTLDQALWIKARVEGGNDEDAQRRYIQLRAEELAGDVVKDQARVFLTKGLRLWHGQPRPGDSHPSHDGILARLVGGALVLAICIAVASFFAQLSKPTPLNAGLPKTASAPDPKYFYNQPLDFDGVALGQGNVDAKQKWPSVECSASGTPQAPVYFCDSSAVPIKIAGVALFGPFRVHVDPNGVFRGGFMLVGQETVEGLKHQYESLLGPGIWQEHNPANHEPGWAWHRNGVELIVQDAKETNGAVLVGVTEASH